MDKKKIIYLWMKILVGGLSLVYLYYINSVFYGCLSFYGEPPYQWPEGLCIRTIDAFNLHLVLTIFITGLNIIILISRVFNRPALLKEKNLFRIILFAEIVLAGWSVIQLVRYGSWTICKPIELYVWMGNVWTTGPFLEIAAVFSFLLLILEIAQHFHEKKASVL